MIDHALLRRRILRNRIALGLSVAAAVLGSCTLAVILLMLGAKGAAGMTVATFTNITPPPGQPGGLANAIYGSLMLTGMGILAGTPVGILTGTYLAEYGRGTRLASVIRFVNDIMLSAPSIVIGLFVYQLMVVPMHHFSGWAGIAALALIAIPIIVRTTEDMLLLAPGSLRESAAALGAPRHIIILHISYRAARPGIVTGCVLAAARISGETAPLLFTALNNQFWSTDLNGPLASLPMTIFQFALSPYTEWQQLAWTAALIITGVVLTFSILARFLGAMGRTK
jgi:phosphate transport system permease protein